MNDMEQFNLEEHIRNPRRKIVTRDGRPVRIICTDRKDPDPPQHPIVALVQTDGIEQIYDYITDGSYVANMQSLRDLFFAPEKQECPFKKGDRVLVRDYDDEKWLDQIFIDYEEGAIFQYVCEDEIYKQCIPFNEHTWKLLGTTNEYKEE